jgi:hypothetical protein
MEKKQKKVIFGPLSSRAEAMVFWGHAEVEIVFFAMWCIWVSKDAEFCADSKNINLPCFKIHIHATL